MASWHALIDWMYGGLPARPITCEAILTHRLTPQAPHRGGRTIESWQIQSRLTADRSAPVVAFGLRLTYPNASTNLRAIVACGDGCWPTLSEGAENALLARGCVLAWFNRTDIAADRPVTVGDDQREAAVYQGQPGAAFGAISAWAWGYQRVLDAVQHMPTLRSLPVVFTGHSRGGKAALLAAATDARVWGVHANNSGVLGAGSYFVRDEGSETWSQLARAFPHWGARSLSSRAATDAPPADQAELLQRISPRKLLLTQAVDDLWANPTGTAHTVEQLRQHRISLGLTAEDVKLVTRTGGHAMHDADWLALALFIEERV